MLKKNSTTMFVKKKKSQTINKMLSFMETVEALNYLSGLV